MAGKLNHEPVLFKEIMEWFKDKQLITFCDMTLGAGGHTIGILNDHEEIQTCIGIDQDLETLKSVKETFSDIKKLQCVHSNFENIAIVAKEQEVASFDGILCDLGVSSMQIDTPERGFSYMHDAPLDMRMNTSDEKSAFDVVNVYEESELARIFFEYGEEKGSRRIAKAIVEARKITPIATTHQLVALCDKAIYSPKKHSASRVFQALRIEVNNEIGILEKSLFDAANLLSEGGSLAVISFHSLEDRIVKHLFKRLSTPLKNWRGEVEEMPLFTMTKKAIAPTDEEVRVNKRCRSSKLRILTRVLHR